MNFFHSNRLSRNSFQNTELLHQLECKVCPLYTLPNLHKDIKPSGATQPEVYVLGLGPGEQEDIKNEFFVGPTGNLLRQQLGEDWWGKTRLGNITRTRDPSNEPTMVAIECCRPSVEQDIAASKPKLVLGLGGPVLKWITGKTDVIINDWRGQPFPVRIAGHPCWFLPTYHPSHILQGHRDLLHVLQLDIQRALKLVQGKTEPVIEPKANYYQNIELLYSVDKIKEALKKLSKQTTTSVDLETTSDPKPRPYYKDSNIWSMSIGSPDYTIGFPWRHPEARWTAAQFRELAEAVFEFFCSRVRKIAHNLTFELEWLMVEAQKIFGKSLPILRANWGDSMVPAYCLGFGGNSKSGDDETFRGLLGLDVQIYHYFGFFLKSLSKLDIQHLDKEDLEDLLLYNCLDTKYCSKLYEEQVVQVKREGLQDIVYEHERRIPTLVAMQLEGLRPDIAVADELAQELDEKVAASFQLINNNPAVIEYKGRFGSFNPMAPEEVLNFFRYLGFDMVAQAGNRDRKKVGKQSADKNVLASIDHPLAREIVELRETNKLKSTYVDIFREGKGKTYVVTPDGLVHSQFTSLFTTTGRLSSKYPNLQNFPKRKNSYVRKIIAARAGYTIFSIDFGQIEFRVIAMASKDTRLVQYIWDGHDVHEDWAVRVAKAYPPRIGGPTELSAILSYVDKAKSLFPVVPKKDELSARERQGQVLLKAFRAIIKNMWVFPGFYNASAHSMAGYIKIPESIALELYGQFWDEFSGVRVWQATVLDKYQDLGYIESLTHRRRYAYLEPGQIINTGIQGTASDILMDGFNKLSEEAELTGHEQYQAKLNIHDDLTFELPFVSLEADKGHIIETALDCQYPFINVPLTLEGAEGPNWDALKPCGVFTSKHIQLVAA